LNILLRLAASDWQRRFLGPRRLLQMLNRIAKCVQLAANALDVMMITVVACETQLTDNSMELQE